MYVTYYLTSSVFPPRAGAHCPRRVWLGLPSAVTRRHVQAEANALRPTEGVDSFAAKFNKPVSADLRRREIPCCEQNVTNPANGRSIALRLRGPDGWANWKWHAVAPTSQTTDFLFVRLFGDARVPIALDAVRFPRCLPAVGHSLWQLGLSYHRTCQFHRGKKNASGMYGETLLKTSRPIPCCNIPTEKLVTCKLTLRQFTTQGHAFPLCPGNTIL